MLSLRLLYTRQGFRLGGSHNGLEFALAGKYPGVGGFPFALFENNLSDPYARAQFYGIPARIVDFENLPGIPNARLKETGCNVHHQAHSGEAATSLEGSGDAGGQ